MASLVARLTREMYRREQIPVALRFLLASQGMRGWFRQLASSLRPHLGDRTKPVLAELAGQMFKRRYAALRGLYPDLPEPEPRAIAEVMGGLYGLAGSGPLQTVPRAAWILDALGGPPQNPRELFRALKWVRRFGARVCWEELTVHLGELLIVLTEELPQHLPGARRILGDLCFEAGVRFAKQTCKLFDVPAEPRDPAASAIEILRMSEYLFRVNPKHWGETNASAHTGWLEGTACPWYSRPGWQPGHCGIFGQFQAGISSVFGLRYQLGQTIPKHGGHTCRVDLKPIQIGKRPPLSAQP